MIFFRGLFVSSERKLHECGILAFVSRSDEVFFFEVLGSEFANLFFYGFFEFWDTIIYFFIRFFNLLSRILLKLGGLFHFGKQISVLFELAIRSFHELFDFYFIIEEFWVEGVDGYL